MLNQVHLITYADRLGGTIPGLTALLRTKFEGVFAGVHVLPFYTPYDGADAGFDPVDHTKVDPRLGDWGDIAELATTHEVMSDLIVNHVSAASAQFRDVMDNGSESRWASMFLTLSSVFPRGATERQLTAIFRPRHGLPFTAMRLGDRLRYVWTTFTPHQVDIDVRSEPGRAYLQSILHAVTGAGVSAVRLDAVGYAIKTKGTSCFMTPQTFDFIADFTAQARATGAEVLVEVRSHFARQVEIARLVDLVYDFALPALILHALYTGDGTPFLHWLRVRPNNAITVLDTHDGIGVVDVGPDEHEGRGLLTSDQLFHLVQTMHRKTKGTSVSATGVAASNVDLYQVNTTYYDALGGDDACYLAARTLQFFTPGIPQVYYVGALAGSNDVDLLSRSGVGRDINRHHYTSAEIDAALERPVVRELFALCRFRNTHPAFDGPCRADLRGTTLTLSRRGISQPQAWARAEVNLAKGHTVISWGEGEVQHRAAVTELSAHWPDPDQTSSAVPGG